MSGFWFRPKLDDKVDTDNNLEFLINRLYKRHVRGAWIRSGASLGMWLLAFPPFRAGYLDAANLWGISIAVMYLILINPPLLFMAGHLKTRRGHEFFSILVNILEILGYTAVIHFVGGLDATYLLPIYCALIAYVGMLSPIRLTILTCVLCMVFFDGMVLLEHFGVLANYARGVGRGDASALPIAAKLTILAAVNGLLFVVALICARIGGKLRENRLHIREQNIALKKSREDLERKVDERTADLERTNLNLRNEIEERRRAEEEGTELRNQLHHARKMEAVGALAGGIAHDFNNILHAVSGYVQLLKADRGINSKSRRYLDETDSVVNRAVDLVQRLMVFSYQADPVLKPVDLNHRIRQTLKILEHILPKMIEIKTKLDQDLYTVSADPGQIERIMMNLSTNARDAMPQGGTLSIETRNQRLDRDFCRTIPQCLPGDYVQWTVSDTGQGMDEQTVERIFEPFFTTKDIGRGTGLGMYTVYGIVKAHGGHVACRSRIGRGTVFDIYLPVSDDRNIQVAEADSEAPGVALGGTETILLVDDEHTVLDIGREILLEHGYTVITEDCGEKALERLEKNGAKIDLVILDLGMPGMGGLACLKEITVMYSTAKVIIASGYSQEHLVREALNSGAGAFINKPYRLIDMLKKVREILDDR